MEIKYGTNSNNTSGNIRNLKQIVTIGLVLSALLNFANQNRSLDIIEGDIRRVNSAVGLAGDRSSSSSSSSSTGLTASLSTDPLVLVSSPSSSAALSNQLVKEAKEVKAEAKEEKEEEKLPLCNRAQISQGEWRPRRYDRLPYLPKQIEAKSCYTPLDLTRPWDSYEWQPFAASKSNQKQECRWEDWNADEFCDLAWNQTIALAGDSLSLEHFSALVHMLGVTTFDEETAFTDNINRFEYHVCPHNTTKLAMYRNNFLWLKGTQMFLQELQPDLVILNRGSWYEHDDKLLKRVRAVAGALETWQQQCLERRRDGNPHSVCRAVWRTTVPGHPQCTKLKEPVTAVHKIEEWIANKSHYHEETMRYHWYDFQHQNELVQQEFDINSTSSLLAMDILDAHKINILRPDEHIAHLGKKDDCLHNCQPGGTTLFYNQWLLHLLRQTRQQTFQLVENMQDEKQESKKQ